MAVLHRMALAALVLLAGCNGSESSSSGPSSIIVTGDVDILGRYFVRDFAPYEAVATSLRTSARYMRQANRFTYNGAGYDSFPLGSARIEYAHAVGLTGQGQTIAISDGGFLTTHATLAGRRVTSVGNPGVGDHGTAVASIAVGDSATMIGVAPDANLILGPIDNQAGLAATAELARTRGAVALNNSWGYVIDVSPSAFSSTFASRDGARYLAALQSYANQGVVVFALSNDETDTRSSLMAALPVVDANLTAGWLAVGNAVPKYDAMRIISASRLSASCLETAQWCLVADGFWNAADANGNASYSTGTGSSYAAPQVSGALALLAQAFPTLSPHDLRLRLLASADNGWFAHDGTVELASGFRHGYSLEFGHGFLNLRGALLPIGQATLSVNGGEVPIELAAVRQGSAVGDAVEQGLADVSLNVTDSMQAGFGVKAAKMARVAAPMPLAARISGRPNGHAADIVADFSEFSGTEMRMAIADTALTLRLLASQGGNGSMGMSLNRRFDGDQIELDLGLSVARDGGEVFGLGNGVSGDGTYVATMNIGMESRINRSSFLRLGAEAGVAVTNGGGLLGQLDQLGVNAFSAEVGAVDVMTGGDSLVLGLSTPMTVVSGHATTRLSTLGENGQELLADLSIALAPSSREQVLAIGYEAPLAQNATLSLDLAHALNWGNRRAVSETAAGISLSFSF